MSTSPASICAGIFDNVRDLTEPTHKHWNNGRRLRVGTRFRDLKRRRDAEVENILASAEEEKARPTTTYKARCPESDPPRRLKPALWSSK